MSLSSFVAKVGSNPYWIAANAHAWFTCSLTLMGVPWYCIVPVAAWKEFYFDAWNEKDPPQTFMDNATDFLGYCAGIVIALVFKRWVS